MGKIPSLERLESERRQKWIRGQEQSIRADAKRLGVKNPDRKNLWKLLDDVHKKQDELKYPALKRRAERLGVRTSFLGIPRGYTDLFLACVHEEDRQLLARQLGYK